MSRLEQFAKESSQGIKQTTLRCPVALYYEFKEYVEKLNMNVNEAIVKLMELEMSEVKQKRSKSDVKGDAIETAKKDVKQASKKETKKDFKEKSGRKSGGKGRTKAKTETKAETSEDIKEESKEDEDK